MAAKQVKAAGMFRFGSAFGKTVAVGTGVPCAAAMLAQKTQPMAQPAWLLTQAVTRPVKRIRTVSIRRPSANARRYLRVKPSVLCSSVTTGGRARESSVSSRVRSLARDLDAVVWAVNPRNDSLADLVAYLSQFYLELFGTTAIRPRLDAADEFPDQPISPEARHHLFLAAKEAMNNVIKHAQAREVRLKMGVVEEEFELKLGDNGRGFSTAAAETSNRQGLKNLRTRVEELGGRCSITSQPGSGTCVCLTVPLRDNPKLRLGGRREG